MWVISRFTDQLAQKEIVVWDHAQSSVVVNIPDNSDGGNGYSHQAGGGAVVKERNRTFAGNAVRVSGEGEREMA